MTEGTGTVYRALQSRAKRHGLNTQQQLELYVHERLLARIAASPYVDQLILKGGMLLAALDIRGVTRDADLAATAIDNDPEHVRLVMRTIASIDLRDEVAYDLDAITVATMREDDAYHGLRIKLPCMLHSARLVAQVDMSFGDPISGRRRRIPAMLGSGFSLLTYSVEALLAEKLVTMIARGDANTRDRDFGDIWLVGQQIQVVAKALIDDIRRTAAHRGVDVRPLAEVLVDIRTARRTSWRRYRARTGLSILPAEFDEVLAFCIAFADPLLAARVSSATWSPETQTWLEGT